MPGMFTIDGSPVDTEEEQEPPGIRQWVCAHYGATHTYETPEDETPDVGMVYNDEWFSEEACDEVARSCDSCNETIVIEWDYRHRQITRAVMYGDGQYDAATTAYSTCNGDPVCEDCYHTCEGCGDGYGSYEDAQDCCENSYDDDPDNDDETSHGVRRWGYRPQLIFRHVYPGSSGQPIHLAETEREMRTLDSKTTPVYFGIELEVEDASHLAAEFLELVGEDAGAEPRFLFAKTDGSLSHRGIELNLFPSTPEYLRSSHCDSFRRGLDWLADNAVVDSTCGMHIHLSRSGFTSHHLWKFLTFHHMNPTLCQTVARRGSVSYAKWNGQCMDDVRSRLLRHIKRDGSVYQDDRYLAINHQNQQTIELRYFAGAIRSDDVYRNIEWVQSLVEYTKGVSVNAMKNGKAGSYAYLAWLRGHSNKYPLLYSFLDDQGLFAIIPTSTTTLSA